MKIVTVLVPNVKGRALVQFDGKIYIIKSLGYWKGQELPINIEVEGIEVPSLLYGIAMLYNDDFEEAVKFIKENW